MWHGLPGQAVQVPMLLGNMHHLGREPAPRTAIQHIVLHVIPHSFPADPIFVKWVSTHWLPLKGDREIRRWGH